MGARSSGPEDTSWAAQMAYEFLTGRRAAVGLLMVASWHLTPFAAKSPDNKQEGGSVTY
jgi:hypothetical protein